MEVGFRSLVQTWIAVLSSSQPSGKNFEMCQSIVRSKMSQPEYMAADLGVVVLTSGIFLGVIGNSKFLAISFGVASGFPHLRDHTC